MEEQDIKEAKRARNFIWMAACDYDIERKVLQMSKRWLRMKIYQMHPMSEEP